MDTSPEAVKRMAKRAEQMAERGWCDEAIAPMLLTLLAERDAFRVDAERWDYCRQSTPDLERFCGCTAAELDRAIDAARSSAQEAKCQ